MCKVNGLHLSIEMCGCLSYSQFVFALVWSSSYIQYRDLERAVVTLFCASIWSAVCTCVPALVCIRMCALSIVGRTYVYVCAIWPQSVLSSCPCSMFHDGCVEPIWSGEQQLFGGLVCFFQGKAYVGLTSQAVQGSHQNELFIRSNANKNCSH